MIGQYENYIKPRMESDPEFRQRFYDNTKRFVEKVRNTDEYKESRRATSKAYYEKNKELCQEKRREYARKRRAMLREALL